MDVTSLALHLVLLCSVVSCCPDACTCENLSVVCSEKNLLWMDLVSDLPGNVDFLSISSSTVNFSSSGEFLPVNSIFTVDIHRSTLVDYHPSAFSAFVNVENIVIANNTWLGSSYVTFQNLSRLTSITVGFNNAFYLDKFSFHGLHSLQNLTLCHNKLTAIPKGIFDDLGNIQRLDLSHNDLSYIDPKAFFYSSSLQYLDLSNNLLVWLDKRVLGNMSHPQHVFLRNNRWACNCGTRWLTIAVSDTRSVISDRDSLICDSPANLKHRALTDIHISDLHCEEPTASVSTTSVPIAYMETVVLVCNTTGDPQPSSYWITPHGIVAHQDQTKWMSDNLFHAEPSLSYNGQPTFYNASVIALPSGNLLFKNFRYFFSGEYICVAENPAGNVRASVNVSITDDIADHFEVSVVYGFALSGAVLVLGIIIGTLRTCIEHFWCKQEKDPSIVFDASVYIDEDDEELGPPGTYPFSPFGFFWSPSESRQSPKKCVTPAEGLGPAETEKGIEEANNDTRERLEDVRALLRHGMARSVGRIRSSAQQVRQTSSRKLSTIRQNSTVKLRSFKSSTGQYVHRVRSSTGQYVHRVRSSTGQYVHRVRSGVTIGMEQVKGNIQSIKELCGTGDLANTVSTISVATDVDSNQTTEVVKTITYL